MMCGHTNPEVESQWGDYGDMAQRILQNPESSNETWQKFNVCDGQFPSDEDFQVHKIGCQSQNLTSLCDIFL